MLFSTISPRPGFAAHSPFQCVQTGILAPAFFEQVVFAVHAGHVHGEHHTLVAVFLRSRSDEGRVFDGPELTLTLSAPALSTRSKSSSVLIAPPTVRG